MSHLCSIPFCDSTSMITCTCCDQNLCREHFVKHDYFIRSKLNELTEEINHINNQLDCFDIKIVADDILRKLDQWRLDSYKVIDKFYEENCTKFSRYIHEMFNKQKKEANELQLKLAKIVNVQQITDNNMKLILKDIKTLERQMNRLEYMPYQIDVHPLLITDKLIDIDKPKPYQSDLSKLLPSYQMIGSIPMSSNVMTSNNQYLLIHQNSNLCLIDQNLTVIRQTTWPNGSIEDMCWSESLQCFLVITLDNIYRIEVDTLSIKHVQTIEGRSWQSCTCSDTSLYLSRDIGNSSIDEFDLISSFKFVKHYERTEITDHNQRIDHIEYYDGNLVLTINDQSKQNIFIELRSITTFNRLWICELSINYTERKLQCTLCDYNTWLVADYATSSLIYITKDGKVKKTIEYDDEIRHINIFDMDKLVISTGQNINIYKL